MKYFAGLIIAFLFSYSCLLSDTLTVAADGSKMFTSVTSAISVASNGDIISIFGEMPQEGGIGGIIINKSITLQGQGRGKTILYGDLITGAGNKNIITIYSGNSVTIKNISIADAGEMAIQCNGDLTMEYCEVRNADFRLVYIAGSLNMSNCYIHDGYNNTYGSGIYISSNNEEQNYINNSCISDCNGNGLIINANNLQTKTFVMNTTISGNSVSSFGGGGVINFGSILYLENCTISDNHGLSYAYGGGINLGSNSNSVTYLRNTIVAGNTGYSYYPDIYGYGTLISLGNNLIGDIGGVNFSTNTTGDRYGDTRNTTTPDAGAIESATAIDPLLGPLQNNGGLTLTHALLGGSPAIDNGANTDHEGNPVLYDQRNFKRTMTNFNVDIGAYEFSYGIPTLSEWAAIVLGGLMIVFGIVFIRKQLFA